MPSSRAWGNAFLVGCSFVVAYAVLLLAFIFHRRARDGDDHHPHGGCPVERFAWLSLTTGVTGIVAACTTHRSWLFAFPVVLLITEVFVLAQVSATSRHAVRHCVEVSLRVDETVTVRHAEVAGIEIAAEHVEQSEAYIDEAARAECLAGIRHTVVLACLIIGVVSASLMLCGTRLAAAVDAEEAAAEGASDEESSTDESRVPLTKADPLAVDAATPTCSV